MDISLEKSRTTGLRQHRPAQVWMVTSTQDPDQRLVARMYESLYYENWFTDRFATIERAVAIENAAYGILQEYQRSQVPRLCGVFVTEITGCGRLRHIYVVLLEYIPGENIRHLMQDETGKNICDKHKASIVDAVARLACVRSPWCSPQLHDAS
ncbi:hypothetical protein DFH09DRAFT_1301722 [Mycena vulgaris]|nr:hypothetical protein DFH09DRAFT_1301722 [Mycena vulgaris]